MTLNRKIEGQGHREWLQFRRSHQGVFPWKISSLYWLIRPRTNLNAKVNQNYSVTLNRKSEGQGHRERSQFRRSYPMSIPMQGIKSVLINATENELKRKGWPKLLSDLEQKRWWSGSQGKVAVQEISPRFIPMQSIKSVLINVTESELKHRG